MDSELVKKLVEIQGGKIEVKSRKDIGTDFIIKLPVKILDDDNKLSEEFYGENIKDLATRINIEFSDIYT